MKTENEGIEVKLSKEKSEEFFYNALCNGLGYFSSYGVTLELDEKNYQKAKKTLAENGNSAPCYEDVMMQMLKNGDTLDFTDEECEGEYSCKLTLKQVHENISLTPIDHLMNMITENDDAETADVIIQTVLYKDIIFG
jgi:hypothetical protein